MDWDKNWAVVVPVANEEKDFHPFVDMLTLVLNELQAGKIYFVVDTVSKDKTLYLCRNISKQDDRFITVWAPENRNIVDAYLRGFRAAYEANHDIIIEMDAGLSHDPKAIPMFLKALCEGYECALGSRFVVGGSMTDSPWMRRFLSRGGTVLTNLLLGTMLYDMTSGYQGFHRNVIGAILNHKFLSTGHFYQTEIRYLLRRRKIFEVPIHYKTSSSTVSTRSFFNSLKTLLHYFFKRITFSAAAL